MALYQSVTASSSNTWADNIGDELDSDAGRSATQFVIHDTDGGATTVLGTGFTYNAAGTAVTGGTITELRRFDTEQITGLSLNAATFWADSGSDKISYALSGDDTFEIGEDELLSPGITYAIEDMGGGNVLNEEGLTDDPLDIFFDPGLTTIFDTSGTSPIQLDTISDFIVGSETILQFDTQVSNMTFSDIGNTAEIEMSETISFLSPTILDLTSDTLSGIEIIDFNNQEEGTAEIKFNSSQFGGSNIASNAGISSSESQDENITDEVYIRMTSASLDASTFEMSVGFLINHGIFVIDGSASSSNLTITGAGVLTKMYGGSGNDTITASSASGYIYGSTGHDTINGGSKGSTVDYSNLTTPGIVAIDQGTSGTVNKGGANGTDQLTGVVNAIMGSTGSDVFYVGSNTTSVTGNGGFDYLIELTAGMTLNYSNQFTGISEIVSNTGNNTIDLTGDTSIAYLYGSTGNDTLTLGSGGGYLFGEGGINTLTGGNFATNIFEGGAGTNDMLGGIGNTAANYYYVGSNDTVEGSGGFNAVIELVSGVSVVLGTGKYNDIQEFVADGGNNTAVVSSVEADFVYLYGGAGNDTLSTSKGGGYLIGEGGTNTLNGGSGTNVFVADGASGVDTMNGGIGSNIYIIDSHSTVHGAGTFNTVEELQQSASLTLGSASLTGVQQVVFAGGTNSADFHTATSSVFLYGGSGNDTLFGGTGNDFLFGGLGTNTFEFGQGWGKDTIEDWTAGTNSIIDLTALASLGVHAVTDLTQTISGGHDTITSSHTGTNSITLLGVGSALTAGSFHFA